MLASGNVFHTPDELHEVCEGPFWLEGAAMYDNKSRPQLKRLADEIASLAVALLQHQLSFTSEYQDAFSFHPGAGCDVMGVLTAVNALLIDIVNSEGTGAGDS
ncbi:Hypothetical protein, putative [Bodo saltans]|uniref:Uncharacterized protein n=1 Tax=Bodo saltans TaxID=75058 RepID=A0A0S4JG32_BODSA|nr:Hypothetical protein, putative [Bodo saltans]|eukprot:CUG88391.1 Hypothetical protein, putative [Bodo saltans]